MSFSLDADLFEHVVGRGDLIADGRVGRVGHVQQQVGLPGLFQRGLEAGDQMVRQVADEPDRVAQQHRPPAGQLPAAGAGVERGEQGVLRRTRRRRSARSAACSCRRWCSRPARRSSGRRGRPPRAACGARSRANSRRRSRDALLDQAAVLFQLLFARPAQARRPSSAAKGASTSASAGASSIRAGPARRPAGPGASGPGWRRCRGSAPCGRAPSRSSAFSRLRVWPGVRSLSKMTRSASVAAAKR